MPKRWVRHSYWRRPESDLDRLDARDAAGNLRAVQEQLRHAGIQTTIYTRLAP